MSINQILRPSRILVMGTLCLIGAVGLGAENSPNLITNGGFEKGTAESIPGWTRFGQPDAVTIDRTEGRSGKASARAGAHGGLRSQLVRYRGQRVLVSGWIKTKAVVRGRRPWNKAALQLISYGKNRKSIGHSDVLLVEGTHDWAFYQRTFTLSHAVAYVAVHRHIWGPKARGTAWFDDLSLQLLDNPDALPPRERDLTQATVAIDFSNERVLLPSFDAPPKTPACTNEQL